MPDLVATRCSRSASASRCTSAREDHRRLVVGVGPVLVLCRLLGFGSRRVVGRRTRSSSLGWLPRHSGSLIGCTGGIRGPSRQHVPCRTACRRHPLRSIAAVPGSSVVTSTVERRVVLRHACSRRSGRAPAPSAEQEAGRSVHVERRRVVDRRPVVSCRSMKVPLDVRAIEVQVDDTVRARQAVEAEGVIRPSCGRVGDGRRGDGTGARHCPDVRGPGSFRVAPACGCHRPRGTDEDADERDEDRAQDRGTHGTLSMGTGSGHVASPSRWVATRYVRRGGPSSRPSAGSRGPARIRRASARPPRPDAGRPPERCADPRPMSEQPCGRASAYWRAPTGRRSHGSRGRGLHPHPRACRRRPYARPVSVSRRSPAPPAAASRRPVAPRLSRASARRRGSSSSAT